MKKSIKKLLLSAGLILVVIAFIYGNLEPAHAAIVDGTDPKYSYNDMKRDIKKLAEKYPDRFSYYSLGKTKDNREIYCVVLGNPDAPKQIAVQASIHAREWINTQVIMKRLDYYCMRYNTGSVDGVKYKDLFEEVAVYVIPMVNPDGVSISQFGFDKIRDKELRRKLKKMPLLNKTPKKWKANAMGVDLNRNFPARFRRKLDSKKPASEFYCGKKAGNQRETKACMNMLNDRTNLKACLNYHSMGKVIYWGTKEKGELRKEQLRLKNLIHDLTGYRLIDETRTYGNGGDEERYIMEKLKIPYACIETGAETTPVPHKEFNSIYGQVKLTIEKTALLYY